MKNDFDSKEKSSDNSDIPKSLPSDFSVDNLDILSRSGLKNVTYRSLKSGQEMLDRLDASLITNLTNIQLKNINSSNEMLLKLQKILPQSEEADQIVSGLLNLNLGLQVDLQKIQSENALNLDKLEKYGDFQKWLLKMLFGKKSERTNKEKGSGGSGSSGSPRKRGKDKNAGKLSEKYPHLLKVYKFIYLDGRVEDRNLCDIDALTGDKFEVSETLETRPKSHFIQVTLREKVLSENGCKTASPLPRIVPFGVYGDSFIVDIMLSKFADLCPYTRSRDIAFRDEGLDLPQSNYYKLFQDGARFLECIFEKIKSEVQSEKFIYMDETPYKMLERHGEVNSWYCWGFASLSSVVYLVKNTRSHTVPVDFVSDSLCEIFMSDKYGGYNAIDNSIEGKKKKKEIKVFEKKFRKLIRALCNAHARRNFKNAPDKEKDFYLEKYGEIYKLEGETKHLDSEIRFKARSKMFDFFLEMKERALIDIATVSSKSVFGKALNYFLSSFDQLTLFTKNLIIDLDNNHMERLLRSIVQGRKIWYGSHSPKAAYASQILFSIMMSGRLCNINLREYLTMQIDRLHGYKGEDYYNYPLDERPLNWRELEAIRQDLIMTPFEYMKSLLGSDGQNTG
jgi:transposase